MEFIKLKIRPNIAQEKKLKTKYIYLDKLILELQKKNLPSEIIDEVNQYIDAINSFSGSHKDLRKLVSKSLAAIFKMLEKQLKLVPKSFYLTQWMVLGMAFGVPLGVVFGTSHGNMGLLGVGIPIGMLIGTIIGARMDKKAAEEGRQLDLEMKY